MKIWAISKEKGAEYEIGLECDGMDRETAMTELYRMARNLLPGNLKCFGKRAKPERPHFNRWLSACIRSRHLTASRSRRNLG